MNKQQDQGADGRKQPNQEQNKNQNQNQKDGDRDRQMGQGDSRPGNPGRENQADKGGNQQR